MEPAAGAVHSITSSARASTDGGIVRPSAFAILRLIAISYLVGCCPNIHGADDARRFSAQIDDIHRHDVAGVGSLIADDRNVALGADFDRIGPEAASHYALGIGDLAAVNRENRNPMIAVTGDERSLAVRCESHRAWTRFRIA